MRVVVNRTLCESNAVCARLVPEIFLVDDDDRLQIKQEQPPEALRERVEHAVRRCPKLALSIVEDGGRGSRAFAFRSRSSGALDFGRRGRDRGARRGQGWRWRKGVGNTLALHQTRDTTKRRRELE
jgi:ferredoxin